MLGHTKNHRSFLCTYQGYVYKVVPTQTSLRWDMKEFFLLQTLHILLTKGGEPYKILAKLEKLLQKTSLISIWQAIVKDEIRKKLKTIKCSTISFGRSLILMEKQISPHLRRGQSLSINVHDNKTIDCTSFLRLRI